MLKKDDVVVWHAQEEGMSGNVVWEIGVVIEIWGNDFVLLDIGSSSYRPHLTHRLTKIGTID